MADPFEEISFLTRSENRVEVLGTLSEDVYTERELVDKTGISKVTVGRITEDFLDRGWIRETEEGYEATRLGDLLAEDYARLSDSMDLACRLGPVRGALPLDEMDFDLRHLVGARVSDPETFDSLQAVDRWIQLLRESNSFLGIAAEMNASEAVGRSFHEEVTGSDMEFGAVVSRAYYEEVNSHPEMARYLRETMEAGGELYLASEVEDFDFIVAAYDEAAAIVGFDDTGNVRAGIETNAGPFRDWIIDTYESYRENATQLTPEDFAE